MRPVSVVNADRKQFERIVREHGPWMQRLCQRLLGDAGLAEDGVQEAMITIFRKLPELKEPAALKGWLYRITLNQCLTMLRRKQAVESEFHEGTGPECDKNGCRIEAPWAHFETPEALLQSSQNRQFILARIAELPEPYRLVLLLRDIEEFSTVESAELLEITETNVKVRLHRARAALKVLLEPLMRGDTL